MTWGEKRQLKFLALALFVTVVFLSFIVYKVFLSREPTCFDGKMNGVESGVDCGGSCQKICLADQNELLVKWSRVNRVTDKVYNLTAFVENRNREGVVNVLPYKFTVLDSQNQVILERKGQTFIETLDRIAIIEPGVRIEGAIPSDVFFEFLESPDWQKKERPFAVTDLVVEGIVLDRQDSTPRLKASLVNKTLNNMDNISVIALLYDTEGNLVASSSTFVDSVQRNNSEPLVFTWPQPILETVGQIEVIPRIDYVNFPI